MLTPTHDEVRLAAYQLRRYDHPDAREMDLRDAARRMADRIQDPLAIVRARDARFDGDVAKMVREVDQAEQRERFTLLSEIAARYPNGNRAVAMAAAIKQLNASRPELFDAGAERADRQRGLALARYSRERPWMFLHLRDAAHETPIGQWGRRASSGDDQADARELVTRATTDDALRAACRAHGWDADVAETAVTLTGDARVAFVARMVGIDRARTTATQTRQIARRAAETEVPELLVKLRKLLGLADDASADDVTAALESKLSGAEKE